MVKSYVREYVETITSFLYKFSEETTKFKARNTTLAFALKIKLIK